MTYLTLTSLGKNSLNIVNNTNFELNLEQLKKKDFNDEFLERKDDYSPSWRIECEKLDNRMKNNP